MYKKRVGYTEESLCKFLGEFFGDGVKGVPLIQTGMRMEIVPAAAIAKLEWKRTQEARQLCLWSGANFMMLQIVHWNAEAVQWLAWARQARRVMNWLVHIAQTLSRRQPVFYSCAKGIKVKSLVKAEISLP